MEAVEGTCLCKDKESKLVKKIICFPENVGTSQLATNVNVDIKDFKKILRLIHSHKIDLVIVGPEELCKWYSKLLQKNKVKVLVQTNMPQD